MNTGLAKPLSAVAYHAAWVFPSADTPIPDASVVVDGGHVLEIVAGVPRGVRLIELGDAAIVPTFVNAHTHLEFSDLPAPTQPAQPFTAWIRMVVANRRERLADATRPLARVISRGLGELYRSGTLGVGEISTSDERPVYDLLAAPPAGLSGTVFREVLAPVKDRVDNELAVARRHLEATWPEGLRAGLSPHAPYTVHPALFEGVIELAVKHQAPIAMHLAETWAERELLEQGTGELAEMLASFGAWDATLFPRPDAVMGYLEALARSRQALVIHGTTLNEHELQFLASKPNLCLVYCPRTTSFFGQAHSSTGSDKTADHPWLRLIEMGGRVAIGTDSRASNPNLSLFEELQFLASRHPNVADSLLLHLGTAAGAEALGLPEGFGSIAVGAHARLAGVSLGHGTGKTVPPRLFAPQNRVQAFPLASP